MIDVLGGDEDENIKAYVNIRVVHGRDLYPDDGKTSDPYCFVIYPNSKYCLHNNEDKKISCTEVVDDTVNSIWK